MTNPPGLEFFDSASNRQMKYVYPDSGHWTAGWIVYKHTDGQWVTLRKATEADIAAMNKAVVGREPTIEELAAHCRECGELLEAREEQRCEGCLEAGEQDNRPATPRLAQAPQAGAGGDNDDDKTD